MYGVTFTATGSPGDSVTVTPSGIFTPLAGASATPGAPGLFLGGSGLGIAVGGDAAYDSVSGTTVPAASTIFIGGTITIVPVPASTAATTGVLCLLFLGFRRWRARAN